MALGTPTLHVNIDARGMHVYRLSFAGDGAYPTGGTTAFTAFVEAAIKTAHDAAADASVRGPKDITILSLIAGDCGQYVPSFDAVNNTLFVRDGGHATWDEVAATTNLSGTTFNVTVLAD